MYKHLYIVFFLLYCCAISSAQQHDRFWHLGYQGGPPVTEKFGISILDFTNNQLQITSDVETF